jgi:hypothetical protein
MNFESHILNESFGFFKSKNHEDEIHDINYHHVLMDDYDEEILENQPESIKKVINLFINNEIKSIKYINKNIDITKRDDKSFKRWIIKFNDNTSIKLIQNQNKDIEEYFIAILDKYIKDKIYRITRVQFHIIENSIKEYLK